MIAGDAPLRPLRDPGAAGLDQHVLLMLGFLCRVSPGSDGETRADHLINPVVDGPRHVLDAHQVARRRAHEGVIGR
ncbi:hypothetical protein [Streptomyces sp. NPDC002205]|uniref:hypothetical protein n=1 Tax=Streptomyces sp. NPDC002205 TaxID=3154411 RepID=UPI003326CDE1